MAAARSLWHVMNSLIFHVVLLAYLLASLTFWFHLGLRRRWIHQLASGLLAGGFVLQTALLGYRLWTQTFLAWDGVYAYLGLLSWAIIAAYLITVWRYPIDALGAFIVPLAFLAAAVSGRARKHPHDAARGVPQPVAGGFIFSSPCSAMRR